MSPIKPKMWFRAVCHVLVFAIVAQIGMESQIAYAQMATILHSVRPLARISGDSPTKMLAKATGTPLSAQLNTAMAGSPIRAGLKQMIGSAKSPLAAQLSKAIKSAPHASLSSAIKSAGPKTPIGRYALKPAKFRALPVAGVNGSAVTPLQPIDGTAAPAADPKDPYIVAEAQALNNDPNQIFAFVRDQIGTDVYQGSLRGARGTLWTKAGNALDRASLLIALLGAAGFQAQYVEGTIDPALGKTLISRMFPTPSTFVGCPDPSAPRADPLSDPQLNAAVADHFWVEYGPGQTTLDASFPNSQPGQVFGIATTRFTAIPDSLKHTTELSIIVEMQDTFGQTSQTRVFDSTFETAPLFGKPLTVGFDVSSAGLGGLFTTVTHTYTPRVRIAQNLSDPSTDLAVLGIPFQELISNFAGASQLIRSIFLNITSTTSQGNTSTVSKALVDRVGYAGRTGRTIVFVAPPPNNAPAVLPSDAVTLNIAAGNLSNDIESALQSNLAQLAQQEPAMQAELASINQTNPTPSDQIALQQITHFAREEATQGGRALSTEFLLGSDAVTARISQYMYARVLWDTPHIVAATFRTISNGSGVSERIELDNLTDAPHILLPPDQVADVLFGLRIARGALELKVEQSVLAALQSGIGGTTLERVGVADILEAAATQQTGTLVITSENQFLLDGTNFSDDAKARISDAAASGKVIIVPAVAPVLGGRTRIAWTEYDPVALTFSDSDETGGHVDALENIAILEGNESFGIFSGLSIGFSGGLLGVVACCGVFNPKAVETTKLTLQGLAALLGIPALFAQGLQIAPGFIRGLAAGVAGGLELALQFQERIVGDPAVPSIAAVDGDIQVAGSGPGLSASVIPDNVYTLPANGAQLPLVYRVQIANSSPTADSFSLTLNPSPGYNLEQSVQSVFVPANSVGTIGVCAVPTNSVTLSTASVVLNGQVASTTNPANAATVSFSSTVGLYGGLQLSVDPAFVFVIPGQSLTTHIGLQWFGSDPSQGELQVQAPPGISVSPLQSPVALTPGASSQQTMTVSVDPAIAIGSSLAIQMQSGAPTIASTPIPSIAILQLKVVSSSALPAYQTAPVAERAGRTLRLW